MEMMIEALKGARVPWVAGMRAEDTALPKKGSGRVLQIEEGQGAISYMRDGQPRQRDFRSARRGPPPRPRSGASGHVAGRTP